MSNLGLVYPAAMKGVILLQTDGRPVDVARDPPWQDVRAAAFWLRETLLCFPPTVHLVVADPNAGADRHTVVLWVGDHIFVGPDNGASRPLAGRIAAELSDDAPTGTYEIDIPNSEPMTFHRRDVLAPVAVDAHVTGASAPGSIGRFELIPVGSLSECRPSEATVSDDNREATGGVLVVDDFGNYITSVPGAFVRDVVGKTVWVDGESVPVGHTFEAVAHGEKLVMADSHGNVECNVNHGRGDEAFGLAPGDRVEPQVDR